MSHILDYNEASKIYDSGRNASDAHILKSMMESVTGRNVRDMDIIDIACGTGNYAQYFRNFEPQSLTLIDASEGMLSKAREKLMSPSTRPQLSFRKVILPDMPYADNSFDAGMINMVLHHLEDHPDGKSFPTVTKALKEVYRILKPGGVLTILTETPENLDGNWFAQLYPQISQRYKDKLPNHKQIKDMLAEAGFSLKSSLQQLSPSYLPDYDHLEGPLEESWRNVNSYWTVYTESEIQEMIKKVIEMKKNGSLEEYYEKHDNIETVGTYEIFAAKKELK